MRLTWYGSNSWLLEVAGQRIAIDPWLVGPLEFGGISWFFRAIRAADSLPLPQNLDLILLSQGLPDHAHPPTLKQFDRAIPVVGSPKAAKLARELGYSDVTALDIGEQFTLADRIDILATEGALTGIKPENGYLLALKDSGTKLYYEPHGFHADSLQQHAPVDVAIGPVANIEIPVVGAFIRGKDSSLELVKMLRPQYFLQSTHGNDGIEFSGLLTSVLSLKGSLAELQDRIRELGISTQAIAPKVGEPFELNLASPAL
ncbi:MBL fold metallo-hydrolase [Synechococcus sp. PCC 7336]|uniref:MBL fold metallo-hydrolase n=1 Tax=Synechococcus sp. PCC 7336 TaxID=195250 RepID=UPI000348C989|nr:MBL fold metallo-hydrolase [Synechococcus sp. PCC 7336]